MIFNIQFYGTFSPLAGWNVLYCIYHCTGTGTCGIQIVSGMRISTSRWGLITTGELLAGELVTSSPYSKGTVTWDFYGYFLAWMDVLRLMGTSAGFSVLKRVLRQPIEVLMPYQTLSWCYDCCDAPSIFGSHFKFLFVSHQTFSEIRGISEKDWQLSWRFSNFPFSVLAILGEMLERVSILLQRFVESPRMMIDKYFHSSPRMFFININVPLRSLQCK